MDALLDVDVVVARAPLALADLTVRERDQFDGLPSACRRREWLTGRRALRSLLHADTSAIRFPNTHVSLTHSGGVAVAAGTMRDDVAGVGVDFESRGGMRPAGARFFLDAREYDAVGPDPRELVRLWTVKEALFKANVANAGTTLLEYSILDPRADCGEARGPARCGPLRYLSTRTAHGIITIAIAERSASC